MQNNRTYSKQKTTSVTATASVVTALSVAERGLGFLYRIVLSRLLGAEGLGLYQVSLSVFSVFLTIGTGGIPLCVSRLISKSKAENKPLGERQAVSSGLTLCLLLTLPICIFMGLFAQCFPFLFSDERCIVLFKLLLTGLAFSALYAVFRGYFWGNNRFLLPSFLEIAEETVMVIVGVVLLQNVQSSMDGATKAVFAVILSYVFSFTASAICFFVSGGKLSSPKPAFKPLFRSAMPITAVRASGSLINSVIAVVLPIMLIRAGLSQTDAIKAFGVVSGMAMPVLFIPATLIGSLALVLVPRLSEDYYRKATARLYGNIRRGLRVSFLVACALTPFFAVLGDEVGLIAFASVEAGEFIRAGAPLLLPLSLTMISTSILNSMGFERQTLIFYFLSAAALLLCVLFLPAVCGVYAYLFGLAASYILNAVCNFVFLSKKCKGLFRLRRILTFRREYKAVLSALVCFFIGTAVSPFLKTAFGEMLAPVFIGVSMAISLIVLYLAFQILPIKPLFRKRKKNLAF